MTLIFKIAGLFTVFAVCVFIGFSKSYELNLRAAELEQICICLNGILTRLNYGKAEKLKVLNSTFGEKRIIELTDGKPVITAAGLTDWDKEKLQEFLFSFGSGDFYTEENRIKLYLDLFKNEKEKADRIFAQEGKLYRTAGICGGAAICLFLM